MLEPNDRRHLFDALRPPPGYDLDYAVGTTFSLDLLAMLTAPLAFTLFDYEAGESGQIADPLALLQAIRTYADRIAIFCQAGRISVPKASQLLYSYLEGSVFEVLAPKPDGVFHPKVWVLRFAAPEPEQPVLYRLLCLSRNLTFDRSWDTALVMEGALIERQNAFAVNHPLADFVNALPGFAIRQLATSVQAKIDLIQDELRRVEFVVPEGFDKCHFWPLGLNGAAHWPFHDPIDRLLVVSPFLSEKVLTRLAQMAGSSTLISRADQLDALAPAAFEHFDPCYMLNEAAEPQDTDETEEQELSGLHAKLYVAEYGWDASVWTGSANATNAAFNLNVEFLIELSGKRSQCGINACLGADGAPMVLRNLLQLYTPPEVPAAADPVQKQLEALLEIARRKLAVCRMVSRVQAVEGANLFGVQLQVEDEQAPELPAGVEVYCWPITMDESSYRRVASGARMLAEFKPLSLEALTPFIAFEAIATRGDQQVTSRFVLNAVLSGAPADRRERLLRALLTNRDQVMRFILFLLGIGDPNNAGADGADLTRVLTGGSKIGGAFSLGLPLFEVMVQTLARDPARLDAVARLVDDLRKTPEGRQLLPDDFDSVWEPLWDARKEMAQ